MEMNYCEYVIDGNELIHTVCERVVVSDRVGTRGRLSFFAVAAEAHTALCPGRDSWEVSSSETLKERLGLL